MLQKSLSLSLASMMFAFALVGAILIAQEKPTTPAPQPQPEKAKATENTPPQETETPKIPEYYLGIQCVPVPLLWSEHLNLDGKGMLIRAVVPGGPAEKAGIKQGDIILSIGGKDIKLITDIFAALDQEPGKEQTVGVLQKGKKTELKITPEKRPETPSQLGAPETGMMRTIQPGIIFDGKDSEEARRLIRKFIEQMEDAGVGTEMVDPNRILSEIPTEGSFDGVFKPDPNSKVEQFEVRVLEGDKPDSQRIYVRQNNEVWNVKKIEDLPKELQDRVREMIGPMKNQESTLERVTETASDAWNSFTEKTQKEFGELETEMKKAYENVPDLQEKFDNYRKATEEYFKNFWNTPEEKK